jgi:transketolase
MPSWGLFLRQPAAYRDEVLPPEVPARVAIEAALPLGWDRFVGAGGAVVGMLHFGASAPAKRLFRELGFTVENVVSTVKAVLEGRLPPHPTGGAERGGPARYGVDERSNAR